MKIYKHKFWLLIFFSSQKPYKVALTLINFIIQIKEKTSAINLTKIFDKS